MDSVDFSSIPVPEPDVVFGMKDRYNKDPSPLKVNLVIGAYRDEQGK
jgi:aspartate/tyrosine/aromatic aminotransferase